MLSYLVYVNLLEKTETLRTTRLDLSFAKLTLVPNIRTTPLRRILYVHEASTYVQEVSASLTFSSFFCDRAKLILLCENNELFFKILL